MNGCKTFLADAVSTAECDGCTEISCELIGTDRTDQKFSPRWCLNGHSRKTRKRLSLLSRLSDFALLSIRTFTRHSGSDRSIFKLIANVKWNVRFGSTFFSFLFFLHLMIHKNFFLTLKAQRKKPVGSIQGSFVSIRGKCQ